MILIVGALLGFFSVAFGAYSEHGLRPNVSDEEFRMLMTAIRYNQVHALIISVLGLITLPSSFLNNHLFRRSGFLFILGTILFSFSIYTSVGLQKPIISDPSRRYYLNGFLVVVGLCSLPIPKEFKF